MSLLENRVSLTTEKGEVKSQSVLIDGNVPAWTLQELKEQKYIFSENFAISPDMREVLKFIGNLNYVPFYQGRAFPKIESRGNLNSLGFEHHIGDPPVAHRILNIGDNRRLVIVYQKAERDEKYVLAKESCYII